MSDVVETMRVIFGGDCASESLTAGQAAARAAIVFLFGLVVVRVGKSRLISRVTPLDVILGLILGSIWARAITGRAALSTTASASIVLAGLHWLLTRLACRNHRLGNLIKGHTRLLVRDGKIITAAMSQSHISEHDLYEEFRLNANLENINLVQAAYKERSGEVSVVKREPTPHVLDIRVENGVQTVRIELRG
jgi:uncharacterized membrane protein YcaP (DUF421 family)